MKVLNMADKSSSAIVNKLDEQLKKYIVRVVEQTEEIDGLLAPYYSYQMTNYDCNVYIFRPYHIVYIDFKCIQNAVFCFVLFLSDVVSGEMGGASFNNFEIVKNDYIAEDKELCDAFKQMQQVSVYHQLLIIYTFSSDFYDVNTLTKRTAIA